MERDIKYTTDGKKVVVLGNLNSQEKIVQEIFIIDGNEIPSGESFVVKSLHDSPAVSWKADSIIKDDLAYEQRKTKLDILNKKLRVKENELYKRLEYTGKVLQKVSPESFDTIVNYLTGKIKWVIEKDYTPKLTSYEDYIKLDSYNNFRLLSIYGKDDGSLNFKVNRWDDGSGSNDSILLFTEYEDAFEEFSNIVKSEYICPTIFGIAKTYNIELDAEKVSKWKIDREKTLLDNIKDAGKKVETAELELIELKKL